MRSDRKTHVDNEPQSASRVEVDPEKRYSHEYDDMKKHDLQFEDSLPVPALLNTTERKLIAKIDWRLIPPLCILYLLAFLDRVNIANAVLFGLEKDLGIPPKSTEYNNTLVIFFVSYIAFEIPSNVLLKKLRPHIWLPGCMFAFGLVMWCQGLVQNYAGLLATRFFLGLAETGMFPGCFYLISMWYKRSEAQKRYWYVSPFFFSSTTLAGAFGGLLASAIGKMNGLRGYHGWRWIFILEGVLTCVVAIVLFFVMPDFPEDAKWLTEEERAFVKARLEADQGRNAVERNITLRDIGRVFKDFKVALGGLMYLGMIVPAYGYAYFSPTIINGYGYSAIATQLHSVPPWAAAFVLAMIIATASDLAKHRFVFTLIPIAISIAGFGILLGVHHDTHTEYAALFLVAAGTYSAMPVIICWFTMNLGGHHRRAVGTAFQIAFGNIGGIIAVYAFLKKDAPFFTKGYSICIGFSCLSILSCCLYGASCIAQNRSREKTPRAYNGLSEKDIAELGDLATTYRYQL